MISPPASNKIRFGFFATGARHISDNARCRPCGAAAFVGGYGFGGRNLSKWDLVGSVGLRAFLVGNVWNCLVSRCTQCGPEAEAGSSGKRRQPRIDLSEGRAGPRLVETLPFSREPLASGRLRVTKSESGLASRSKTTGLRARRAGW